MSPYSPTPSLSAAPHILTAGILDAQYGPSYTPSPILPALPQMRPMSPLVSQDKTGQKRRRIRSTAEAQHTPKGRKHGKRNTSPDLPSRHLVISLPFPEQPFWANPNYSQRTTLLQAKDVQHSYFESQDGQQDCGFCR
jgi:hypothetical protein